MSKVFKLKRSLHYGNPFLDTLLITISDQCRGLPSSPGIKTSPQFSGFPVDYGHIVTIECVPGYSLIGYGEITCVKDTGYTKEQITSCKLGFN